MKKLSKESSGNLLLALVVITWIIMSGIIIIRHEDIKYKQDIYNNHSKELVKDTVSLSPNYKWKIIRGNNGTLYLISTKKNKKMTQNEDEKDVIIEMLRKHKLNN